MLDALTANVKRKKKKINILLLMHTVFSEDGIQLQNSFKTCLIKMKPLNELQKYFFANIGEMTFNYSIIISLYVCSAFI